MYPTPGSIGDIFFSSTEAQITARLGEPMRDDPSLETLLELSDVVPPEQLIGARQWVWPQPRTAMPRRRPTAGIVIKAQFPIEVEDAPAYELHIGLGGSTARGFDPSLAVAGFPVPQADAVMIQNISSRKRVTRFMGLPGPLSYLDYTAVWNVGGPLTLIVSAYKGADETPPWHGTREYDGEYNGGGETPYRLLEPGSPEARAVIPPEPS